MSIWRQKETRCDTFPTFSMFNGCLSGIVMQNNMSWNVQTCSSQILWRSPWKNALLRRFSCWLRNKILLKRQQGKVVWLVQHLSALFIWCNLFTSIMGKYWLDQLFDDIISILIVTFLALLSFISELLKWCTGLIAVIWYKETTLSLYQLDPIINLNTLINDQCLNHQIKLDLGDKSLISGTYWI